RKSMIAAMPIKTDAQYICSGSTSNTSPFWSDTGTMEFIRISTIAMQPKNRFNNVNMLGNCFIRCDDGPRATAY
ncbi:MAG TPA: hypothetical protein VLJ41_09955, partial [Segetibacter sp.]|nr:hypothetical protein [Segetibacter sp.]